MWNRGSSTSKPPPGGIGVWWGHCCCREQPVDCETWALINGNAGEMESGGDTTTPAWRLLAAATHPPSSASASGGCTAAAANSLSVVDARSETRTPTDEPGQVPLVDPPQNASVAIASGCDAIATAGVLLAEAARRQLLLLRAACRWWLGVWKRGR